MGDLKLTLFLWNNSDWIFDKMILIGGSIFVCALLLAIVVTFIDESKLMGKKFAAKHLFYQLFAFINSGFKKKNHEMMKEILAKQKLLELEENKANFFKSFINSNLSNIKKTVNQTQEKIVHNKKMNIKN
jgi:hypothetical protein